MIVRFDREALDDFERFSQDAPKIADKIISLLRDIAEHPETGIGKPEELKHNWRGWWSRRITREHRLVYRFQHGMVFVALCSGHY